MHDLKAAAKTLRHEVPESEVLTLAAQALEAWAWQQETGALTQPGDNGWWVCISGDGSGTYAADTPLGALMAAMEGESK
jgi:hypothetical protein